LKLTTKATGLLMLLSVYFPAAPFAQAQGQSNKAEVIRQAGASYYNLRKYGLTEFQARVAPTWEVISKGVESNPEALKLLRNLKFTFFFGANDEVRITQDVGIAAPNAQVEGAFKQIIGSMEEMLDGIFKTWSLFMIKTPFPPAEGESQLKDLGSAYLLTFKESSADIAFTMTKDFSVTELKVVSPNFSSSIRPQFTKTEKGNVLIGYSANYVQAKGLGKVELNIQIDNQDVNGLKLPQRIRVHSVLDGEAYETEMVFSDYQVKTH
jgi:hypothetical protein